MTRTRSESGRNSCLQGFHQELLWSDAQASANNWLPPAFWFGDSRARGGFSQQCFTPDGRAFDSRAGDLISGHEALAAIRFASDCQPFIVSTLQ